MNDLNNSLEDLVTISKKAAYPFYEMVKDKDISVNVISKSGTTTEPAIAFRIFKDLLYNSSAFSKSSVLTRKSTSPIERERGTG